MTVPTWVQDSIFYQIFPDRFENGDRRNDPPNVQPWGASPTLTGFHGGDFRGIIERIYYLQDLGVNAVYLNPIFLAPSTHRYNTTDYFQIDPKLGSMTDFLAFLDVAHRNQMKVLLDGVFNHCGRGFFAFADLLENQAASPYKDWFHVRRYPVDAYSSGDATTYEGWWKYKSLPKFNTNNPDVRQYLMNVARFWVEQGIDGWRLDVPNEINDDGFWAEFRATVRAINPDAYLLGEIWDGDRRWVGDAHFDGLMNYPVRTATIDLFKGIINSENYVHKIRGHYDQYPFENCLAMYNLLGSHDTERFSTMLGSDWARIKLAYLVLFSLPGASAIYYGDEIGLTGAGDPECRRTFPWDESTWNHELRNWIKSLVRIRKNQAALRRGEFSIGTAEESNTVLIITRGAGVDQCITIVNPSANIKNISLSVGQNQGDYVFRNLLSTEEFMAINDRVQLEMKPWSGKLLIVKR